MNFLMRLRPENPPLTPPLQKEGHPLPPRRIPDSGFPPFSKGGPRGDFRLALALTLTLTGCVVGPDYQTPLIETPESFSSPEAMYTAALPEVEWWRLLGDETLDTLVAAALQENHDLRIAQANVLTARAFLGARQREFWPIATTQAAVTREEAGAATLSSGTDRTETYYSAGLDAVWELDFFGRVRRGIEAQGARYEGAVEDRRAVAVTVTAEVTRTYLELRGAQYRLAVARRNADNQRETYKLTQALLDGGRGTDLDLARAQAQLESTLATLPPLEAEVARTIHRLGVLVGRGPTALQAELAPPRELPILPELVPVADPASLLRRRPDIRAAERQLAANTADIGVAVADLFPRVSLTGSFGFLATSAGDLGTSESRTTSFGPFLQWAAFDLGRVKQRIAAERAEAEGALAFYEQTVLEALEETENALVAYARSRERQEHLAVAAEASERAADLARVRYRYGVDSFLTVLDAERRLLEAQDLEATSATETALAYVAVYKALGGGWQDSTP